MDINFIVLISFSLKANKLNELCIAKKKDIYYFEKHHFIALLNLSAASQ